MIARRTIRRVTVHDIQAVLHLIDSGRKIMIASGNTHQWDDNHHSRGQIAKDIANDSMKDLLDWCFSKDGNIRIDTHKDNTIMRHRLRNFGFTYCGIIHLKNGDERQAY
jgi:hypothetical protein